jgi:hypothetical protein
MRGLYIFCECEILLICRAGHHLRSLSMFRPLYGTCMNSRSDHKFPLNFSSPSFGFECPPPGSGRSTVGLRSVVESAGERQSYCEHSMIVSLQNARICGAMRSTGCFKGQSSIRSHSSDDFNIFCQEQFCAGSMIRRTARLAAALSSPLPLSRK